MLSRFAGTNGLIVVAGLSLLGAIGCEQNQQMQTWNMGSGWNMFGAGTFNKSYDLQYPVGDTQVINPAAASVINTNTRSNSYSKSYKLQYAVGPTQTVKQGNGGGFASWFRRSEPQPQPQVVYHNSDAGATTYTKNFNLQYAIGSTQGVNGHKVAATCPTNSYQRNYKLQYPIGNTQAVGRGGHRATPRNSGWRRSSSSSGRTAMRSTGGSGSYVVRPGDTLTSIARAHYGPRNAGRWPEILNANRHVISRADEIAPGMRLNIP
ncbi:MAG: LysM peptidoglycan-binding domain-containing protein [Phycisphaerales bacterium]|nr:LysM peptidoglycan-binding domain-containing protein [Phycisphaerales bacterium]MCB9864480.1 LysM peptidoglycan-binding domain-containing protein [Phycisphaerales bacterium]